MDKIALEEFRLAASIAVVKQAVATNELIDALSSRSDDNANMLRILLMGQGTILLALSVLLYEGDTEIEIPQAFKDAFDTGFDTGEE